MSFYNLEPLTLEEIRRSGDALHCPDCGKYRWLMWRTKVPWLSFVPMAGYCRCPAKAKPPQEQK